MKLLLVLPTRSSFMQVDEDILKSACEVNTVYLDQDLGKVRYLGKIIETLGRMLRAKMYDKIVIWFADYHAAPIALLARILRKPCYILIGGYDAVKYPKLGMGVYCYSIRGFCTSSALRYCTHVIANHQALLSSSNTYYEPSGHPEGIYRLVPGLRTPSTIIHNAVLNESMHTVNEARKKQILTIGTTPRLQDFYNKGFDILTEVAKRRPDISFIFVGIHKKWWLELNHLIGLDGIPNIRILPYTQRSDLYSLMRESSVYAQPSISEGMPNALMEAMLMGCVPVGSNVAGIPTVIGEYGFIFCERSSAALEKAIDMALNVNPDRNMISAGISDRFNINLRRNRLLQLLSD